MIKQKIFRFENREMRLRMSKYLGKLFQERTF